jgi:hypothetical protein
MATCEAIEITPEDKGNRSLNFILHASGLEASIKALTAYVDATGDVPEVDVQTISKKACNGEIHVFQTLVLK